MRVLVTGGGGVLGRTLLPLLASAGHEVRAPAHDELDLFDPAAVGEAVSDADAIFHLATRIPSRERMRDREAWRENDRLREEASRLLVDAALSGTTEVYVQPTITFVYPAEGPVDEDTPIGEVNRTWSRRWRPSGRPRGLPARGAVASSFASVCSTAQGRGGDAGSPGQRDDSCRGRGASAPGGARGAERHLQRRPRRRARLERPLQAGDGLAPASLSGRRDPLPGLLALRCVVRGFLDPEVVGDPDDLAAKHLQLALDRLVLDPALLVESAAAEATGTTSGTAQPRRARTQNSIVLIACRPCAPPATLIRPITLSVGRPSRREGAASRARS